MKKIMLYYGKEATDGQKRARGDEEMPDRTIIIDESNSFSGDHRRYLTVASSTTKDRSEYAKAAKAIPIVKGNRKKYTNASNEERIKVLDAIPKETRFAEAHSDVDHLCKPPGKKLSKAESKKRTKERKTVYVDTLRDDIKKTIGRKKGAVVDIVVDTPPVDAPREIKSMVSKLVDEGYNIRWFETDRSASNTSLQVQDYVAGTLGDHVEKKEGTKTVYETIKDRIIGSKNDRKK